MSPPRLGASMLWCGVQAITFTYNYSVFYALMLSQKVVGSNVGGAPMDFVIEK